MKLFMILILGFNIKSKSEMWKDIISIIILLSILWFNIYYLNAIKPAYILTVPMIDLLIIRVNNNN